MTVIKLVNELIGKEDISWGDSSATFARETYGGGSTNIHYIDAEIIPSTTLGGYIGDNLHVQATDTGTTSPTFEINSAGNSITLDSTGLTADRTFTFPDGSDQVLVGATDLAATTASKGASTVGVYDTGGYFSGGNVEAVLAELGADISTLESETHNSGMKNGFKLSYSSTTALIISGGMWAHNGTTNQHLYTASAITFTLGPAGSNSDSSNLAANQLHYIYIDDSAVVASGSRLLTATEFMNSTTVPAWSHSKVGWYNGSDRCIGAVLLSAASLQLVFAVYSGNYHRYHIPVEEFASAAAGTTYAALNLASSVPVFSTRVRLQVTAGAAETYVFDTYTSGITPEIYYIGAVTSIMVDVVTTSAQIAYWYSNGGATTTIKLCGYYMDEL